MKTRILCNCKQKIMNNLESPHWSCPAILRLGWTSDLLEAWMNHIRLGPSAGLPIQNLGVRLIFFCISNKLPGGPKLAILGDEP